MLIISMGYRIDFPYVLSNIEYNYIYLFCRIEYCYCAYINNSYDVDTVIVIDVTTLLVLFSSLSNSRCYQ